jgi:hypothetical protein
MNKCIKHHSKWVKNWFSEKEKYYHTSFRIRTDNLTARVCMCGKRVKRLQE